MYDSLLADIGKHQMCMQ